MSRARRRAAAILSVWALCVGTAAPAVEDPDRLASMQAPAFCTLAASMEPVDAAQAAAAYRANRTRAAAAAFGRLAGAAADPAARLDARIRQARALKVLACDTEAMEVLATALRQAGDDPALAAARCLARARLARLTVTRDVDAADRLAQQVLACAADGADDAASEAHTTRAIVALSGSRYAPAQAELDQALARAASPLARAEALRTLGDLRRRREADPESARATYLASAEAAREAGDPEALALALVLRAQALPPPEDEIEPPSPDDDEGRALARAGEMRRVIVAALLHHGRRLMRRQTGRSVADAGRDFATAAALCAAIGDRTLERALRLELGSTQMLLGHYAAARTTVLRARELALAAGLQREADKSLQALGTLARLASPPDLPLARRLLEQALDGLRRSGDEPADVAGVLTELALVDVTLGDAGSALARLREAQALSPRLSGDPVQATLQATLGWAHWRLGQAPQASAAWWAAVRSGLPQAAASGWWGLAELARPDQRLVALGRYARAIDQVERSAPPGDLADDASRGAFDRRFSDLYRAYAALLVDLGLPAQAQRAALLTQRRELTEGRWTGTRDRGDGSSLAASLPTTPEPLAECPASLVDEERRVHGLRAEQAALWRPGRIACCRDDGQALAGAAACAGDTGLPAFCAADQSLKTALKNLLRAQETCIAAVMAGRKDQPASEARFALPEPFRSQWANLTDGTEVVQVVTIAEEQRLHVLVRAPGDAGLRTRTIPVARERLEALVKRLAAAWDAVREAKRLPDAGRRRQWLADDALRLQRTTLRELHDLLFGAFDPPALPERPAPGSTIAFVLDRALRGIPVSALHDGEHYLGERFATVLVTPAVVGARPPASTDAASLVMGVSEPDLPHVEGEVGQVAQALHTTPFLNAQSTRQRLVGWLRELQAARPALALHLATHASMGGTKGSAVIQLGGQETLTGIDLDDLINGLRRVQLVTFSACGSAGAGEGDLALGLAGLVERGTRSVVGSLWSVDDASTARLMEIFYTAWRRDAAAGVAQALAQAQRELMRDPTRGFAHPYFWAPFVVVGRWD